MRGSTKPFAGWASWLDRRCEDDAGPGRFSVTDPVRIGPG